MISNNTITRRYGKEKQDNSPRIEELIIILVTKRPSLIECPAAKVLLIP